MQKMHINNSRNQPGDTTFLNSEIFVFLIHGYVNNYNINYYNQNFSYNKEKFKESSIGLFQYCNKDSSFYPENLSGWFKRFYNGDFL